MFGCSQYLVFVIKLKYLLHYLLAYCFLHYYHHVLIIMYYFLFIINKLCNSNNVIQASNKCDIFSRCSFIVQLSPLACFRGVEGKKCAFSCNDQKRITFQTYSLDALHRDIVFHYRFSASVKGPTCT